MAFGIKALRKVQIGVEVTAGTAVNATNVLIGEGTLQDTREIVFQKGDVGAFLGNQNTRTAKLGGELVFEQEATFEQIGYPLNASIAISSADADVGGSAYIYIWSMPSIAPAVTKTYTLEAGDNISTDVEVMPYSYVQEFTLSGKGGEPLMMSTTWRGRSVAVSSSDAFTSDVAVPTVEAILFSRGQMWLNSSTAAIATTTADNTLMAFELKYNSGIKEVWSADGLTEPTFSFTKMTAPEALIDITFEHESVISPVAKAAWRADLPQFLRLHFNGSTVTTTGTLYDNKVFRIDAYGKWISFDKLDEMDGNDILKGTFKVLYDSTGTSLTMDITVSNELNGLI